MPSSRRRHLVGRAAGQRQIVSNRKWAMNDAAMVTIARYSPLTRSRHAHHQPAQHGHRAGSQQVQQGRRAHVHLEHRHRVGAQAP